MNPLLFIVIWIGYNNNGDRGGGDGGCVGGGGVVDDDDDNDDNDDKWEFCNSCNVIAFDKLLVRIS